MPTLPYAPPNPRSRRQRLVRWGLILTGLVALVAVTVPIFRLVQGQYDHWMMQRALAACLTYEFPEDTVAYVEGEEALSASTASAEGGSYNVWAHESPPSASWIPEPWTMFTRHHARIAQRGAPGTSIGIYGGVAFLGRLQGPAGAQRLVVVSVRQGFRREVNLAAQVIDPNPPNGLPATLAVWQCMVRERSERQLSILPGRIDPLHPGRIIVPLRYGDQSEDVTFTLGAADEIEVTGRLGWRDPSRGNWWLDTPN